MSNTSSKHQPHKYLPHTSTIHQNQIPITIHHSRHPSDNLCGVRYLDIGRVVWEGRKEIDWERRKR
jgi:hypothetical protein